MRDILDHFDAVPLRDLQNGVHVGGVTDVVDDDDSLRALGDAMLDVGGVKAEGIGVNVGEHHRRAQREAGQGGGPVSHARTDNLVAHAYLTAEQGGMEGCRAGVEAERVLCALPGGELLLELLGDVRVGHAAPAQHLQYRLLVLLRDKGPGEQVAGIGLHSLRAAQEG